jgi:hypothetical protein
MNPLPYPYSDWDQRPEKRAPVLRGCELYEAYGRFLDRMRAGTICEDDGGWADSFRNRVRSDGFLGTGTLGDDSGAYDSHFGYTTEEECERHRIAEEGKLKRAIEVNRRAANFQEKWSGKKIDRQMELKKLRDEIAEALLRGRISGVWIAGNYGTRGQAHIRRMIAEGVVRAGARVAGRGTARYYSLTPRGRKTLRSPIL